MRYMTINKWLSLATKELKIADISSARLDAELILSHTIRKPRTYLHAHDNELLDERREAIANARLQMRIERTPLAYIIGHKEFYGRRFKTTPAALIPRPESEAIIEILRGIIPQNRTLIPMQKHLVDVGTGTGCLGITAKLEWPELEVTLVDISNHALNLARENATTYSAKVNIRHNDLLRNYPLPIDIVLANLPYVDRSWEVSPETTSEPPEALYANNNGLSLIYQLIEQTSSLLQPGGHLLLESDKRQQASILAFAKQHGFSRQTTTGLITHFVKSAPK